MKGVPVNTVSCNQNVSYTYDFIEEDLNHISEKGESQNHNSRGFLRMLLNLFRKSKNTPHHHLNSEVSQAVLLMKMGEEQEGLQRYLQAKKAYLKALAILQGSNASAIRREVEIKLKVLEPYF